MIEIIPERKDPKLKKKKDAVVTKKVEVNQATEEGEQANELEPFEEEKPQIGDDAKLEEQIPIALLEGAFKD